MAVALWHPTAIMVQCMRVNATFKCKRAASFFDVCSQNRRRLFSLHRRDVCAVSVLVSKHFFRYRYRIDTGGIGRYRVPDAGIGLTLIVSLSPVDYKAVSLTKCNLLLLFCPSHHCVMITTTAGCHDCRRVSLVKDQFFRGQRSTNCPLVTIYYCYQDGQY